MITYVKLTLTTTSLGRSRCSYAESELGQASRFGVCAQLTHPRYAERDCVSNKPFDADSYGALTDRAPRKIPAYGILIGVHGRGTARLFDPRPLIEAV